MNIVAFSFVVIIINSLSILFQSSFHPWLSFFLNTKSQFRILHFSMTHIHTHFSLSPSLQNLPVLFHLLQFCYQVWSFDAFQEHPLSCFCNARIGSQLKFSWWMRCLFWFFSLVCVFLCDMFSVSHLFPNVHSSV